MITLTINGKAHAVDAPADMPLLVKALDAWVRAGMPCS
jgi:hypothetical protein